MPGVRDVNNTISGIDCISSSPPYPCHTIILISLKDVSQNFNVLHFLKSRFYLFFNHFAMQYS
jgi:hypothetical protein